MYRAFLEPPAFRRSSMEIDSRPEAPPYCRLHRRTSLPDRPPPDLGGNPAPHALGFFSWVLKLYPTNTHTGLAVVTLLAAIGSSSFQQRQADLAAFCRRRYRNHDCSASIWARLILVARYSRQKGGSAQIWLTSLGRVVEVLKQGGNGSGPPRTERLSMTNASKPHRSTKTVLA